MNISILEDLNLDEFITFDVETTGLEPEVDSVIEFSAVLFKDGKVEDKLTFLCKPERKISSDIELLTGISNAMVKDKASFDERIPEVIKFVEGKPLVAHNIGFDIRFLKSALKRTGQKLSGLKGNLYDTLLLARAFYFYLSNHKLGTVAEYLDLSTDDAHRAEADAVNTGKIFVELIKESALYDYDTFQTINRILKNTREPNKKLYKNLAKLRSFNKDLSKKSGPGIDWEPPRNVVKSENRRSQSDLDLEEFFGSQGVLSEKIDGYEERPQQEEFAKIVYNTLEEKSTALIEAGTGVGKSLGYIIPCVVWNTHQNERKRIVITSNTKNLQEQIFRKEIPFAAHDLQLPFSAVLLKGRKNYICLTRWNQLLNNVGERVPLSERSNLIPLIIWLKHTKTGDISENNGFPVRYNWRIWSEICSEPGYCTTSVCRKHDGCFLGKARFAAGKASVVVVNHSLLMANAAADNKVLPPYSILVVDEAHNFEKNGYSFFADEVRQTALSYLLNKFQRGQKNYGLVKQLRQFSRQIKKLDEVDASLDSISDKIAEVREISRQFFMEIVGAKFRAGKHNYRIKKRYKNFAKEFSQCRSGQVLLEDLKELVKIATSVTDKIAGFVSDQPSIFENLENETTNVISELEKYAQALDLVLESNNENRIFWYEIGRNGKASSVKLASTPLNVGDYIEDKIFKDVDSTILTSATLRINGSFQYLADRIGLRDKDETELVKASVGSPFLYDEQMKFITYYKNGSKVGAAQTASLITKLTRQTERGIMMLYTSYRALKKVYKILEKNLKQDGISLMAQGISGGRSTILKRFREKKHSVLLGTSSFWEGVDVIGDALEILIIDKLPFPVPSDPIIEANSEEIEKNNGNAFFDYTIPETVLKYRQGIGRLIRSSYDCGVLINLDERVVTKRYGRFFQKAIPVENETLQSENAIVAEVSNFLK